MKVYKNERGAALVLTLFIITLLLLFVLTLSYQVTNTTRQVTTMEKNIDARHVAEMGIEYYHSLTKAIVCGVESITDSHKIESRLNDSKSKRLDPNHNFKLSIIDVNGPEQYSLNDISTGSWACEKDNEEDQDDEEDEDDNGEDQDDEKDEEDDSDDKEKITITFTSTGIAYGKEVTIEDNTITINFEDN